jgi:Zn-dependent protease/CBS domain-containing protein
VNDSVHLGRLAGIRVGAHWSLLVVFALIAWSLAVGLLPGAAPHQPAAAYWAVALVTAVLFFASLLAHEMAHALLARRLGLEIEGITLWLFGGVAKFKADAAGPGPELRIAVVGPATSLALAALFVAASWALGAGGAPALVTAAAGWLGLINALLGAFNMLPAFPLDGGRVLRALLWMRWKQLPRATVAAARAGRALAFLLIGGGLVAFFLGDLLNGVWFVFLGWFLLAAARAEEEGTVARDALAGLRVADVMSPDPNVAPGWITVDELIRSYLLTHRHSTYPIRSFDGELQGLVTLAQVKLVPPERRAATRVADVAYPLSEVVTASPSEPLVDLVGRLGRGGGGRALVFDQGQLVGIVSPTDVARALSTAGLRGAPARTNHAGGSTR